MPCVCLRALLTQLAEWGRVCGCPHQPFPLCSSEPPLPGVVCSLKRQAVCVRERGLDIKAGLGIGTFHGQSDKVTVLNWPAQEPAGSCYIHTVLLISSRAAVLAAMRRPALRAQRESGRAGEQGTAFPLALRTQLSGTGVRALSFLPDGLHH